MKATPTLPLPSRQYMRDFHWIESNLDQLAREHLNQWVAVHKGRVIAADREHGQVKAAVREQSGDKEVPVYFVDDGTIIRRI